MALVSLREAIANAVNAVADFDEATGSWPFSAGYTIVATRWRESDAACVRLQLCLRDPFETMVAETSVLRVPDEALILCDHPVRYLLDAMGSDLAHLEAAARLLADGAPD